MRRLAVGITALALLGALAWPKRVELLMRVPGIIGRIVDPVGENVPVRWQAGPYAAPSGPRPPNVVVIVADDLGYNDLGFAGGGVANGAVPTPNIDSHRARRRRVHARATPATPPARRRARPS